MSLEKIELEKKYGHLGYHKDIDNSSNLYKIAIKKYENSVRYNLLEEIIDEIQRNDDVKSIIKDKYIKNTSIKTPCTVFTFRLQLY